MSALELPADLRFWRCKTNGITLHVAEAGPQNGRAVVLLHGFPEYWYGWRHQLGALAAAGYRVVAPDQRGYNLSDRPPGIPAYDIDVLARDILGLADRLNEGRILLVGHDWGAAVGWWLASRYADRLEKFVAISAPHPAVWVRAMRHDREQRKRSRYVRLFRLPWLPEILLAHRNFTTLTSALLSTARAGALSEADIEAYRTAWSQTGAMTSMVNWYRALLARDWRHAEFRGLTPLTLVVWGERDQYGTSALAESSAKLCERASFIHLDASHWIQHDAPESLNGLLLDFLH